MAGRGAGGLSERVRLERPRTGRDDLGRSADGWEAVADVAAQFIFDRGDEGVQAERLTGRTLIKVRLRQSGATRGVTPDWRLRDLRRGTLWNIRSADALTDRANVWLTAEAGGAA